jgi:hypothetical protein
MDGKGEPFGRALVRDHREQVREHHLFAGGAASAGHCLVRQHFICNGAISPTLAEGRRTSSSISAARVASWWLMPRPEPTAIRSARSADKLIGTSEAFDQDHSCLDWAGSACRSGVSRRLTQIRTTQRRCRAPNSSLVRRRYGRALDHAQFQCETSNRLRARPLSGPAWSWPTYVVISERGKMRCRTACTARLR